MMKAELQKPLLTTTANGGQRIAISPTTKFIQERNISLRMTLLLGKEKKKTCIGERWCRFCVVI